MNAKTIANAIFNWAVCLICFVCMCISLYYMTLTLSVERELDRRIKEREAQIESLKAATGRLLRKETAVK